MEELPAVTDAGLNEALAPEGRPDAESAIDCADPELTEVETVLVPLAPCATLSEFGLAEIVKSLVITGLMVKFTDVVCVALVPVPVTVRL